MTSILGDLAGDLAAASLALARRLGQRGTMWCVSPSWPHHARHVAVEFVHPVIVGKRALPAVMLAPDDVVANLRLSVRPGDVVLAIGPADDQQLRSALRRADAWGVETIWIGTGPRPAGGSAHHVLWVDDDDGAFNGRLILLYHVLWELTHVCFEHPGLLKPEACEAPGCITCSDEGRPAEVVATVGDSEAVVRTADGRETIDTSLVGPVAPGDLVLVHAGSAITSVDVEDRVAP